MQRQKDRARNAAAIETDDWMVIEEGETNFVGYDRNECETKILRYRKIKQKNKEFFQLILNKNPFYAEMGGQTGDRGWLVASNNEVTEIIDAKRENNLPVLLTDKLPSDLTGLFTARINKELRERTECNHSATHLLHETLRELLGAHIEQKGSYVSPETLRFDFSHFQKVTDEEIREVEKRVNRKIRENLPLEDFRHVPLMEAKKMGAMALFGEKYGDEVRVVRFGTSIELCGGTHISSTGKIGSMYVVSESSIAAGIRRIEAVTADNAEKIVYHTQDMVREIRAMFNNVPNLPVTIKKSIEENAELKKQLADYMREKVTSIKKLVLSRAAEKNGVKILSFNGIGNVDLLKDVAFRIRDEFSYDEKVLFVAGIEDPEKCGLIVMLSDSLVACGFDAAKLIREGAKYIQGGGGGQPHFATAGGKNKDGITAAIDAIVTTASLPLH
jgi:alanyl-tRNA synthetase